jgi:hypothetical protein
MDEAFKLADDLESNWAESGNPRPIHIQIFQWDGTPIVRKSKLQS